DEDFIRGACREYVAAVSDFYGGEALVCYASKAFSCKEMYRIANAEKMGADVVSGGELYTALAAGFPAGKIYFHGNNKTKKEIEYALKNGVHALVADSLSEIELIASVAARVKKTAPIMLRLNPGIEAHTHHYIRTAAVDSKFGLAVGSGDAFRAAGRVIQDPNLAFVGLHTHIGSQIFELEPYGLVTGVFVNLAERLLREYGAETPEFNFGGGAGVRYTQEDKPFAFRGLVKFIADSVKTETAKAGLKKPRLVLEPGRSIVAEGGLTLYTVGVVKEIPGVKKYVCIDGGMFDNPRYALYQAKYEMVLANRANDTDTEKVTLAGKCCESGDIIIDGGQLARAQRGDLVAVFTTGAYNFSMASNYNRNAVPPAVMVKDGAARLIVKPQTWAQIAARDV
ncbi:MAG: diaminopimelate decarboxylase, partial [Clostridiales bacterium]|nr:diaminopimelate decarboxylase [Clostridiales bacterium]